MSDWQNLPHAPASGTPLCLLDEVGDGGREFVFGSGLHAFRLFVVRLADGSARAYHNRCPHYSLPLNVRADQFLTRDGSQIMCRQHLALFALDGGQCLSGAAEGTALTAIALAHAPDGHLAIA